MEGLVFPRLSGINVDVYDKGGTLLPFAAPNLAWVHFDPEFDHQTEKYWDPPDAWSGLFEQAVVSQNERKFDKKENEYRPNGLLFAARDDFQLCGTSL
ncbi:hypothetical protein NLG97_g5337 [Lecanicillium saksenae]|uniref:Uncharacterized protein n=1 Tax=Lecanicillium saksenae TaxID=468837 RepID=A0ACC1QVY0_9HYPO|nr:hypothetical protein NLG97_g5337 [Lecanicillium saksenae]